MGTPLCIVGTKVCEHAIEVTASHKKKKAILYSIVLQPTCLSCTALNAMEWYKIVDATLSRGVPWNIPFATRLKAPVYTTQKRCQTESKLPRKYTQVGKNKATYPVFYWLIRCYNNEWRH